MDTEIDVLRDVSQRLESVGIDFMLTGSVAMSYYAQPRMTRDVDLVIALEHAHAETFVRLFETDYYVDRRTVSDAIVRHSMFNLIHNTTIIKVDCIVLKSDDYHREEFERRRRIDFNEFQTWIVSREDLILSKLSWSKESRSEMQLRDVQHLLTSDCDADYLHVNASALGLSELLSEVESRDE